MAGRRKKSGEVFQDATLRLTALIDVIFLLIIFFLLVSELTRQAVENVKLPHALEAIDDDEPPPHRIIVNVLRSGAIKVQGKQYNDGKDITRLILFLRRAAAQHMESQSPPISAVPVKIRADAEVEYRWVQQVMVACMRAYIWKVSFGCIQDQQLRLDQ